MTWVDDTSTGTGRNPMSPSQMFTIVLLAALATLVIVLGRCGGYDGQKIIVTTTTSAPASPTTSLLPTTVATSSTSLANAVPAAAPELPATPVLSAVEASQPAERTSIPEAPAETNPGVVAPDGAACPEVYPVMAAAGLPLDQLAKASSIASRESHCHVEAHNLNPGTGDDSWCWFQINMRAWAGTLRDAGLPTYAELSNQDGCAQAMVFIYDQCGWGPWTKPYSCRRPG